MKRALLSVYDKTGIAEFARELVALGHEIISTGGTFKLLAESGIDAVEIRDVTGFPECLDGRLKTLHPSIHGGILAKRDDAAHMAQIEALGIKPIDIVAVNLYPFKRTILKDGASLEEAIENIDIGGPAMIRAAAKNWQDVAVLVDPQDYGAVISELKDNGNVSKDLKFKLAAKVFMHTADYDALIAEYLKKKAGIGMLSPVLTLTYEKAMPLRYGENPHQKAALYKRAASGRGSLTGFSQLHGKELSFNNINDAHGALELLREYSEPTVVACKHSNPCGVGSADSVYEAYLKAYNSDPVSVFGGILCANREIDENTADEISKIFIEIVLAPGYTDKALDILTKKKSIRILQLDGILRSAPEDEMDIKAVSGGVLIQESDRWLLREADLKIATKRAPAEGEMEDLLFAWKMVKHVKSNGIAIAKGKQSVGIGPGQVNRIWPTKQAVEHGREQLGDEALKGAVLASDAFFPFPDCVDAANEAGITAIIQPGGSVNDQASIDACDKYGIAMIFTGMRHFRH
ncbi:MAG: bifunctional phosphoribosylaminoimidazolecarboxamide formyltransferase/IMP cyclohydrolase [Clostridiales bacterium]|jgi:phosphoribosylaminoimidazolecarboxamide formyltransferase/IMP cyclohydrolase|nr:bifunctional phosphoribosylaminoimidazolecarboxamide formyltransferase/IMP cyclohydrolase [Clostridiales bacterium]